MSAIYEKDDPRALFEKAEYGHNETTYRSLYNNKYITENTCKCDSESTYPLVLAGNNETAETRR